MKKKLPFRSWFYFRTGYSQYFAFILALGNMLTLTYYLVISNSSIVSSLLPNFTSYVIVSLIIAIPTLSLVGYLHMKRSPAFASEQEVTAEAQPYHYKLPPGIWKMCTVPLLLELLIITRKSIQNESPNKIDLEKLVELEKNLDLLVKGGSFHKPTTFNEINWKYP